MTQPSGDRHAGSNGARHRAKHRRAGCVRLRAGRLSQWDVACARRPKLLHAVPSRDQLPKHALPPSCRRTAATTVRAQLGSCPCSGERAVYRAGQHGAPLPFRGYYRESKSGLPDLCHCHPCSARHRGSGGKQRAVLGRNQHLRLRGSPLRSWQRA